MTDETTLADTASSSGGPGRDPSRARAEVAAWTLLVISIGALATALLYMQRRVDIAYQIVNWLLVLDVVAGLGATTAFLVARRRTPAALTAMGIGVGIATASMAWQSPSPGLTTSGASTPWWNVAVILVAVGTVDAIVRYAQRSGDAWPAVIGGLTVAALGSGYGRPLVLVSFTRGSPGDQRGVEQMVLDTNWVLVALGGAAVGTCVYIYRQRTPWAEDPLLYAIGAAGGVMLVTWITRLIASGSEQGTWIDGRPLRNRRGRTVLPCVDHHGAPDTALAWIESARHEYSSIASFLHVAASLEALGAPNELVLRARHAANDERRHTEMCLNIARRNGAIGIQINDQVDKLLSSSPAPYDLQSIARSSLVDGMVGEGFAAERLQLTAQRCSSLHAELTRLANDEHRHAELGADIVSWCLTVRPDLSQCLTAVVAELPLDAPRSEIVDRLAPAELGPAGLCTAGDAAIAWSTARGNAVRLVSTLRS